MRWVKLVSPGIAWVDTPCGVSMRSQTQTRDAKIHRGRGIFSCPLSSTRRECQTASCVFLRLVGH